MIRFAPFLEPSFPFPKPRTVKRSARTASIHSQWMFAFVLSSLFLSTPFFAGCSSRLPSSLETEASLATTEWLDQQYGLNASPDLDRLLKRISGRLASAVNGAALERESNEALEGELLEYPWQVYVLRDNEINAFSVGSGIIFLTEGLLKRLRTEAELAAVLAHEMSHQLLGHTREAIAEQRGAVPDQSAGTPTIAYSLDREIEADALSLKLLKVARYDIRHATGPLALGYRESKEGVSGIPPEWISVRMAHMEEKINRIGEYLPATGSSREFNRVQRLLFG